MVLVIGTQTYCSASCFLFKSWPDFRVLHKCSLLWGPSLAIPSVTVEHFQFWAPTILSLVERIRWTFTDYQISQLLLSYSGSTDNPNFSVVHSGIQAEGTGPRGGKREQPWVVLNTCVQIGTHDFCSPPVGWSSHVTKPEVRGMGRKIPSRQGVLPQASPFTGVMCPGYTRKNSAPSDLSGVVLCLFLAFYQNSLTMIIITCSDSFFSFLDRLCAGNIRFCQPLSSLSF